MISRRDNKNLPIDESVLISEGPYTGHFGKVIRLVDDRHYKVRLEPRQFPASECTDEQNTQINIVRRWSIVISREWVQSTALYGFPIETRSLSKRELGEYLAARYEVIMIDENGGSGSDGTGPKIETYVVDQDEMSDLLSGYGEWPGYLASVKRL